MSSVGVGIIGFGRIGAEHAGWLKSAGTIDAVAVADATPARQSLARDRGFRIYERPGDLLADARVQAVLVATPTAMHFDHAVAALRAGKHVMVEKPMALDLDASRKLVEEAERLGKVLSVFHNRRWDVDYLTVREAVASGAVGKVINVESRLGQWASCVGPAAKEYRPGWRNEAAFGGGGLYDWGSHFVDQAWRLLHPATPVRVYAQLSGNVWTCDCDDFARLLIDFDSGASVMVEVNTTTTRPQARWHIDGARGSASSPPSLTFDTNTWAKLTLTASPASGPMTDDGSPRTRLLPAAPPGLTETQIWQQFAAAVRGEGPPAVSARSVLPTMALMDAARASSREGRAVKVAGTVDWVY